MGMFEKFKNLSGKEINQKDAIVSELKTLVFVGHMFKKSGFEKWHAKQVTRMLDAFCANSSLNWTDEDRRYWEPIFTGFGHLKGFNILNSEIIVPSKWNDEIINSIDPLPDNILMKYMAYIMETYGRDRGLALINRLRVNPDILTIGTSDTNTIYIFLQV